MYDYSQMEKGSDWRPIATAPADADGTKGMDFVELFGAFEHDARAIGSRKREIAVQTLGNLTILSTELNTAQSNLK